MRTSAFIDGANLGFMQRNLDLAIDFAAMREHFESYGTLVDCIYYIGTDASNEGQYRFLDMLTRSGFSIESKPMRTITNDDGTTRNKANLDIEIVLDMFNLIDTYDQAILVSGDGDFERPLRQLRARAKRFKVIAADSMVSMDLRRVAGPHFIDLESIRDEIER